MVGEKNVRETVNEPNFYIGLKKKKTAFQSTQEVTGETSDNFEVGAERLLHPMYAIAEAQGISVFFSHNFLEDCPHYLY